MKKTYKKIVPFEYRFFLYGLRNPSAFRHLRSVVHPSNKGDFSLRSFDALSCIFIHTSKAAGTSIALSLFGELPYHYTAVQYKAIYGRKTFNSYFKFSFVRNPWDRLFSAYNYLKSGGWNDKDAAWAEKHLSNIHSFEEFVMDWLSEENLNSHIHFWPQYRFICNWRGKPLVNHLAYFETIEEDFIKIREALGVNGDLRHTNKTTRESYQLAYSTQTKEKVQNLYKKDITMLGYNFDGIERRIIQTL